MQEQIQLEVGGGVACRKGAKDELKGMRAVDARKPMDCILLRFMISVVCILCFFRTLFLKQTMI